MAVQQMDWGGAFALQKGSGDLTSFYAGTACLWLAQYSGDQESVKRVYFFFFARLATSACARARPSFRIGGPWLTRR